MYQGIWETYIEDIEVGTSATTLVVLMRAINVIMIKVVVYQISVEIIEKDSKISFVIMAFESRINLRINKIFYGLIQVL